MGNELVERKLFGPGPKRILALDGGGIRGAVTIGMLRAIEDRLRAQVSAERRDSFVLSDYFDLIAGTSTGSIIATWLALGHSAESAEELYRALGPAIFARSQFGGQIFRPKFDHRAFDAILRERLGDETLETGMLRTGLLITAKRVETGSAWILGNNPRAAYWGFDRSRKLRELVRASAAAPSYFDAVEIHVGDGETGLFLDGAMAGYNNPSLAAFLYATADEYGLKWAPSAETLFMLSLGTGFRRPAYDRRGYQRGLAAAQALRALQGLIFETQQAAVMTMQALSNPANPFPINSEVKGFERTLIGGRALLQYERFDPPLEAEPLQTELGLKFTGSQIRQMAAMDNAKRKNIDRLLTIGRAQGERISDQTFPAVFNVA